MELVDFWLVTLCALVTFFSQISALPTCEAGKYLDGQSCISCTPCPPGLGAKKTDSCVGTQDTRCYDCLKGFDYSSVNSSNASCIKCQDCTAESLIVTAACTKTMNTVCEECSKGKFFHVGVKKLSEPRCIKCRAPCEPDEDETQKCTYKSDRVCQQKVPTQEPPTTTVTLDKKKKSDDKPQESVPTYVYVIVSVPLGTLVALGLYWLYKHRTRKARDQPNGMVPDEKIGNGIAGVKQELTEDTHFRDLPYDVCKGIKTELSHLSRISGPGISLQLIAHTAGLSNDFIQLRLNNPDRDPADEFMNEYGSRAKATLGGLIRILEDVEEEYDSGCESHLRQIITEMLKKERHPARETETQGETETQV